MLFQNSLDCWILLYGHNVRVKCVRCKVEGHGQFAFIVARAAPVCDLEICHGLEIVGWFDHSAEFDRPMGVIVMRKEYGIFVKLKDSIEDGPNVYTLVLESGHGGNAA